MTTKTIKKLGTSESEDQKAHRLWQQMVKHFAKAKALVAGLEHGSSRMCAILDSIEARAARSLNPGEPVRRGSDATATAPAASAGETESELDAIAEAAEEVLNDPASEWPCRLAAEVARSRAKAALDAPERQAMLDEVGAVLEKYRGVFGGGARPRIAIDPTAAQTAARPADVGATADGAGDGEDEGPADSGLLGLLRDVHPLRDDIIDGAPEPGLVSAAVAYEVRRIGPRLGAVRQFIEAFDYGQNGSADGEQRAALDELADAEDGVATLGDGMERFLSLFHRSRLIALDDATFAKARACERSLRARLIWASPWKLAEAGLLHLLALPEAEVAGIVQRYDTERSAALRKASEAHKPAPAAES